MRTYCYVVHSDVDENNIGNQDFFGRGSKQAAIKYAKENGNCWVDRVALVDGEYDLDEEPETVWSYIWDWEEEDE